MDPHENALDMVAEPLVIHMISDVNLDRGYSSPPVAPKTKYRKILVIAGNLGNLSLSCYFEYLQKTSTIYDHIFLVYGNIEFYANETISIVKSRYKVEFEKIPNLTVLDCDKVTKFGVDWYGCTLWTKISKTLRKAPVCDFNMISGMTKAAYNDLHDEEKKWLSDELIKNWQRRRIVITHHVPSEQVIEKESRRDREKNSFFYSSCDDMIELADVWICGSDRRPFLAKFKNSVLISNPVGSILEGSEYNQDAFVVIKKDYSVNILGWKSRFIDLSQDEEE